MRSPQTIGVEPDIPGSFSFHATFFVALHSVGRFFSPEMPSLFGPRHWGQFSARAPAGASGRQRRRSRGRQEAVTVGKLPKAGEAPWECCTATRASWPVSTV